MKRKKVDSNLERAFVTALITDKLFLACAAPLLDPEIDLLTTKYTQQIARWCLRYYREYHTAPGKAIEAIYHAWVEKEAPDPTDAEAVSDFLGVVSAEHDTAPTTNVPHLLDELSSYLTLRKVSRLSDTLQSSLMYGNREEALTAIQEFRTVSPLGAAGYNPLKGNAAMRNAFAESKEPVVVFPGHAGRFLNKAFVRDSLTGLQGAEKRKKTWWCFEIMYRALRCHSRVAFFEVGDLSRQQLDERLALRMAGVPLYPEQLTLEYPHRMEIIDKKPQMGYIGKKFPHTLDVHTSIRARKRFNKAHRISNKKPSLMFSEHASGTINIAGIHNILERWREELDFVPDVTIIDYADILAPERQLKDSREQINETWLAARRLSQTWHSAVVMPTQADAASYEVKTQSMKNFSNDKRKNSHITAMLGLNQTPTEMKMGVMRLNWLLARAFAYEPRQCLWVATCIPLGQACVLSAM